MKIDYNDIGEIHSLSVVNKENQMILVNVNTHSEYPCVSVDDDIESDIVKQFLFENTNLRITPESVIEQAIMNNSRVFIRHTSGQTQILFINEEFF